MRSLAEIIEAIQNVNISRYILSDDDGTFPNNVLPLLVYKNVLQLSTEKSDDIVKEILESNGWTNAWVDGIYDYHHYHSTSHEVLAIINGSALVTFGGPSGISVPLEKGDVVIIPAGVAHKNENSDDDFKCVGAYPDGQDYDILKGKKGERPKADENIAKVPLPETDPVFGVEGPLVKNWKTGSNKTTIL